MLFYLIPLKYNKLVLFKNQIFYQEFVEMDFSCSLCMSAFSLFLPCEDDAETITCELVC